MNTRRTTDDKSRTLADPGAGSSGPANGSSHPKSAVVPVVATTGVCTYAAMTALFPAAMAPEIATGLGVTSGFVALQISVVYAGAMVTSLLGGTLVQRIGACRASQVALMLIGAGAGTATAGAIGAFAVGSFLIGLGYGLTNPAASHLLMRFAPARRRRIIFSIKQTGVPLGGVLAGAIAPGVALALGWRSALSALAALAAVLILLLQAVRPRWDDDRDPTARLMRSPFADIGLVWSVRSLRLLSLAGPCFASIQLSLSAFTVTLLVDEMGIGIVKAGLIMSAVQIAGVAGRCRLGLGWRYRAQRRRCHLPGHDRHHRGGHCRLSDDPRVAAAFGGPCPVQPGVLSSRVERRVSRRGRETGTRQRGRQSIRRRSVLHFQWGACGAAGVLRARRRFRKLHTFIFRIGSRCGIGPRAGAGRQRWRQKRADVAVFISTRVRRRITKWGDLGDAELRRRIGDAAFTRSSEKRRQVMGVSVQH